MTQLNKKQNEWIPISQYDFDNCPTVKLKAWIEPSKAAQENGAMAFMDYAEGRCWTVNRRQYKRFTGIIGGQPTHFMPLPPQDHAAEKDGLA